MFTYLGLLGHHLEETYEKSATELATAARLPEAKKGGESAWGLMCEAPGHKQAPSG